MSSYVQIQGFWIAGSHFASAVGTRPVKNLQREEASACVIEIHATDMVLAKARYRNQAGSIRFEKQIHETNIRNNGLHLSVCSST